MTVLRLFNNISRHIKITSRILNFVTATRSNFFELKIRFLYYNLYIVELFNIYKLYR